MTKNNTDNFPQTFGVETINKLLIHRYPFLLIDRVLSWEAKKKITAIKNVTANEPHFVGHFPERPIMPGVLIVEALAQASGVLARLSQDNPTENKYLFLAGVDKARFKRLVVPGDQLHLEVEVIQMRSSVARLQGTATVNNELAAKVELLSSQES